MPQASLFPEAQMEALRIVLQVDERKRLVVCQLTAHNHHGDMLASAGVTAVGFAETELLPQLLSEAALGFLYRDARDATVAPAWRYRERRKLLSN